MGHTTDIAQWNTLWNISPPITARAATAHTTHITHETEPLDTPDNVEFTKEEILAVIEKFDPGKAPGQDGQNTEILLKTFKRFPTLITGLYNECLRRGNFPREETFDNSHNKTWERKYRSYKIWTYQSI